MPHIKHLKDVPTLDRPREKLLRKGVTALSDFELLEVMIGSGNGQVGVARIAHSLLKHLRRGTDTINYESLTNLQGISVAQATRILASLEIARRHLVRDVQPLTKLEDYVARLDNIKNKQQEYFVALSLDGANRLIAQRTITIGTLDTVMAHPREVFSDPIVDRAASIVVAHNHPSGQVRPSAKDIALTHDLAMSGQLLGIPLRDHLILTKTEVFSFSQNHLL